jgi:hypothetical protein
MKGMLYALSLLGAIIVLVAGSYGFVRQTIDDHTQQAQEIRTLCQQGDYETAIPKTQSLLESWQDKSPIFYLILYHDPVLDVSYSAQELLCYLEQGDEPLIQWESQHLLLLLDKILADETLNLTNLF